MYCPKCTTPANDGQRFCRQCGTNLGVIVDAMEGRRGPVDFERLKVDLKDLGNSLRTGFEQAHQEFKKSQKGQRRHEREQHRAAHWGVEAAANATASADDITAAACTTAPKPKRSRESRRYHLQQGMLSIFSGSAVTGAYYLLLKTAAESGLLASLEQIVLQKLPHLTGLVPVAQMLWVFGLIPVATGLAHLINGAFFAPSDKELKDLEAAAQTEAQPLPWGITNPIPSHPSTPTKVTNEFPPEAVSDFSVTEDPTLPLGRREPNRQAS